MFKNKGQAALAFLIVFMFQAPPVLAGQWGSASWGALEWEPLPVNIPVPLFYGGVLLLLSAAIVKWLRR